MSMTQKMTVGGYVSLVGCAFSSSEQIEDPLVIHDVENKSPELTRAIDYLENKKHVFKPVQITNPKSMLEGHG